MAFNILATTIIMALLVLTLLKKAADSFLLAFEYPDAYRTSNMVD